jgi:hypothetical protein
MAVITRRECPEHGAVPHDSPICERREYPNGEPCGRALVKVEYVPATQLAGAVEASEAAAALAERYGEAIVAISAALPNVNRVRAIIASLDTGGQ